MHLLSFVWSPDICGACQLPNNELKKPDKHIHCGLLAFGFVMLCETIRKVMAAFGNPVVP